MDISDENKSSFTDNFCIYIIPTCQYRKADDVFQLNVSSVSFPQSNIVQGNLAWIDF